MAAANERPMRTYGNWRKPMSAGLGQLGSLGTALLLVGLIVVIITMTVAGLVVASVVGLSLAVGLGLLMVHDRHGKSALQRASARLGYARGRAGGRHLYRSGPLGRTPWGTYQLPGLAAQSRLSEFRDSYGRPFALLHIPATAHYTVVFSASPDGSSLVDQEQIDVWVAHWGQWLNSVGNEPGVVAASVTVETAPDTGSRLAREVNGHRAPGAPAISQAMLEEVMATYPAGSATVRAWVAVTFTAAARAGGRRRDVNAMGLDLASRLPGLSQALQATGAGAVRPVSAQELCEVVRVAYEPAAAHLIDAAHAEGTVPELQWNDVGPSASEARWRYYRHDNAYSVTWSMTAAPRGEVFSSVLTLLLAPHRDIDRKRVTLLYRPMDAARSAQVVERDRAAANFRATASRQPPARALAAQAAANAIAREEARGAGLVSFGMLVTATVTGADRLPDAQAAIDNLAPTARLQLRPVYGSQDSAFAAALPLGLVLPHHLKVPTELRDAL